MSPTPTGQPPKHPPTHTPGTGRTTTTAPVDTVSATEAANLAGITYRQIDYWLRNRLDIGQNLHAGYGSRRQFNADDVRILAFLGRLANIAHIEQDKTPLIATVATSLQADMSILDRPLVFVALDGQITEHPAPGWVVAPNAASTPQPRVEPPHSPPSPTTNHRRKPMTTLTVASTRPNTVTMRPSDAARWADELLSPHTTAMRFDRRLGDQLAEVRSQMFAVGSIADPEIEIAPLVPITWRTQLLLVARKMGRTEAADTLRTVADEVAA